MRLARLSLVLRFDPGLMNIAKETEAPRPSWLRRIVIGRNPKLTFARILLTIVVFFLVTHFALLPIRVEGVSMLPTYHENQVNFVNRLAYLRSEPKRGDVVGIRLAGPSIMFLKRIIALPGETLEFRQGQAYVTGQPLPEPYIKYPCQWDIDAETLGPDEYYVVGDNRSMPHADHTKGKAGRGRIVGKILL